MGMYAGMFVMNITPIMLESCNEVGKSEEQCAIDIFSHLSANCWPF